MDNNYKLLKEKYPKIYKQVKNIKIDKTKYELIITKEGLYTLKINEENSFYLHSKYNPIRESKKLIDENYSLDTNNYIVYGLGFGYHIKELLERDKNVQINIIESNLDIFKIALDNINLELILDNPNIKLFIGNDLDSFGKSFEQTMRLDDNKLILHGPSIKAIPNHMKEMRYLLEEFKVKEKSVKNPIFDFDGNFENNLSNYDEVVNILFNKYKDKTIFLVAAGPSLDKNKHLLKKIDDRGIIVSVGRAVKSLVSVGVKPDFVIIIDSKKHIYNAQLKGIDIDVPIIVLATCDENVLKNYKGKKYIAFQNGYEKAEDYAKELNLDLIETGGSVATTALDIAIRMGGNPIVFVGQDLAFSGGQTHSKNTNSKIVRETASLRKVKSIGGEDVYTSKSLSIFLRWIENRIREERDIEFIDATEGGARIEGTTVMKLKDVLKHL